MRNNHDFFISFSSEDKDWAEWIAWILKNAGYKITKQSDFKLSDNFIINMEKSIQNSDYTLALFSEEYLKSVFTQMEWTAALIKQKLIPIRIKECEIPCIISPLISIDFVKLSEDAAKAHLLVSIEQLKKPVFFPASEKERPDFPKTQPQEILDQESEKLLIRLKKKRAELLGNHEYITSLEKISKEVELVWENSRLPILYTPYDHIHCAYVERQVYELIPNIKQVLSPKEIFLLIASVWLHDIGMCPELFMDESVANEFNTTKDLDRKVRNEHPMRSKRYIKEKGSDFGLAAEDIEHLSIISFLHRHKNYDGLKEECKNPKTDDGIRRALLIAYLRLVDALQIPRKTDTKEFKLFLSLGVDFESRLHRFKSMYAKRLLPDPDKLSITIVLKRPGGVDQDEMFPLQELLKTEVQDEIDSVRDVFYLYYRDKVPVYLTVECVSEEVSNMSEDERVLLKELLRNIELFDPALTPNASSVIDNVISQVKLFLNSDKPSNSIRNLINYKKRIIDDIIKQRPSQILLSKVSKIIDDKLQKDASGNELLVKSIKESICSWEEQRIKAIELIPKMSISILACGSPILLYGYSFSVIKCIEYYFKKMKRGLEIYICEGRTKTTYRYNNRLMYSDCVKYALKIKELIENFQDIPDHSSSKIYIVTDSCVSNLFYNGRISKVLFGANGIDLDGNISHTMGHLSIADMASLHKVPVYVIADSCKIGPFEKDKMDLNRDNMWLTTDIDYTSKLEAFTFYNPREDIVPPDRIEAIITEKGMLKPFEIKNIR